jgi:hypothetical protein
MPRLFLLLVLGFTTSAAHGQDLIHYWNFNNPASSAPVWPQPVAATSGDGVLTYSFPSHVVDFAGTTINAQDGDPSGRSFVVQNGTSNVNEGEYFELAVPTTGFESIVLAYATQRTSTGFTSQTFSYSLDGVTFTAHTTVTSIPTSFALRTVDFSSIPGAADNPDFRIRVTLTGGSAGQTTGNNRFDNITVSGTQLGDDPVFTALPASQIVRAGEQFTFTYEATHPDGAAITYSLTTAPVGAAIDPDTGLFAWTPDPADDASRTPVTVRAQAGPFFAETTTTFVPVAYGIGAPTRDLYFSKYIWGGSFNKAVEIFNGTAGTVDLGQYTLEVYFNAQTSPSTVSLSGTLAPGETFVVAHTSAAPEIAAVAGLQTGTLNFNGDDALVLRSGSRISDVIGYVGEPRVSVWGSGIITTGQHSLWRRPDACTGLTDRFNYDYDAANYFVSFPSGTYAGLGSHADSCEEAAPNNPPEFIASFSTKFVDAGTDLSRTVTAVDPDGDEVTYELTSTVPGASLDPQTGEFLWTASEPGVYTVTITATDGWANVTTSAVIGVRGEVCPELLGAALRECLRQGFSPAQTLGYNLGRDIMYTVIDKEEDGFVRGIYTGYAVEMVDDPTRTPRQIMGQGGINAEHVWPQSKGAADEPARSDLHNLFPSHDSANSSRSNWPFAYVAPEAATSWWGPEGRMEPAPTSDFELYSRYGGQQFEPRDFAKGPVSRASLYFFSIFEEQADRAFALVQRDVFEEWGPREVELWELERTAAIAGYQGNANPFLVDMTLAARALTDVVPPVYTVAEARVLPEGSLVLTTGIVTRAAGRYTRLEDDTAGLTIFQSFGPVASAVAAGDIAPGDELQVIGTMTSFNDLVQINVSSFEVLSRNNPLPEPPTLTLQEIANNGEVYESRLIRVEGFQFRPEDLTDLFLAGRTYRIADATADYFTVDFRTQAAGDGSIVGAPMYACQATYTGVLGRFFNTFQFAPVEASDVSFFCPISLGEIDLPLDPVVLGTEVTASVSFADPTGEGPYTAQWLWGDGSSSEGAVAGETITGTHTYQAAGVYTVQLIIGDDLGRQSSALFQYVVVFDPEGGFVTGGGWIHSPAGAYTPDPDLEGRATFGFVSRYQRGAAVPSGNTNFQFRAAGMSFRSTEYEWLVVAGARGQYKGAGTINGDGEYGFMLTAIDSDVNGGGIADRFRIKIWEKDGGEVVYDNQLDAPDDAEPTTTLGGGSIKIHTGGTGGPNAGFAIGDDSGLPTEFALGANYPNPFASATTIAYELPESSHVRLVIFDVTGREVARLVDAEQPAGRHTAEWHPANLASGVYLYRLEAGPFVQTQRMLLTR